MAKLNKSKKNSILNFVAVVVLTVIGLVLTFCSFDIPFTTSHYNGFANSISLGMDLAGGVSVVYECEADGDLDEAIEDTIAKFSDVIDVLSNEYSETTITKQGDNKIRVEMSGSSISEDVFEVLGQDVYFTASSGSDADVYVTGSDIKNVEITYYSGAYVVTINFTSDGVTKFQELATVVDDDSGYVYIYFDEVGGDDYLYIDCSDQEISGMTSFYISYESEDSAKTLAARLLSGKFGATLSLLEYSEISATLGPNGLLYFIIGGVVGLVLIMLFLWLRYGDFGLLASFALVIFMILMLFFLQAFSFLKLTLPGLIGIVISILIAVDGIVMILEKTREEYRSGKKIPLSVKTGFKRAFWTIFDTNVAVLIAAIFLYILGTASIRGFAITLMIGVVLAFFTTLVVMRFFTKWYLPFNSVKYKKLHLPKQTRVFKNSNEEIVVDNIGGANEQI